MKTFSKIYGSTNGLSSLSLSTKFGMIAACIFCCMTTLGTFVFVSLGNIEQPIDHFIASIRPSGFVAHEMEDKLRDTSTDLLGFLRAPNSTNLTRYENDVGEFDALVERLSEAMQSDTARGMFEDIETNLGKFLHITAEIASARKEEAREVERLTDSIRVVKRDAELVLAKAIGGDGATRLQALMHDVLSSIGKTDSFVVKVLDSRSGTYLSDAARNIEVAKGSVAELESLVAPSSGSLADFLQSFSIFRGNFQSFVSKHEEVNSLVRTLVPVREALGQTLDNEVQAKTTVEIERVEGSVYQALEAMRTRALAMWLLMSILLALAVSALSRLIVRPIKIMAACVHGMADGKLDIDIGSSRTDEIGVLSNTLTDASERIFQTRQELIQANVELDTSNGMLEKELLAKKEVVRSLEEAVVQAQAADKAKSAFLTNMCHEFRTPLNGVMGFADAMKQELYGPLGDVRYQRFVRDIHASGEQLLKLFMKVVDVSEIVSRSTHLKLEWFDIGPVLEAIVSEHADQATEKEISLRLITLPGLPQINMEREYIQRAIANLLENAVKFSPVQTEVRILAWHDGVGRLNVQISDEGVGMTAEEISAALGVFGTINPLQADHSRGLGLGISMSKKLIEMNGGSLSIESEPGEGLRVVISLPCTQARGCPGDTCFENTDIEQVSETHIVG